VMPVIIEGEIPKDPRQRIRAIEEAMRAICQSAGEDAADGVMALLTAAVHITMLNSDLSKDELPEHMAHALACAIVTATAWFRPSRSTREGENG